MVTDSFILSQEGAIVTLTLNRGMKGNSYDRTLTQGLTNAFRSLEREKLSAVILTAQGKNFCTGADLNWMENSVKLSPEENLEDLSLIRDMYAAIVTLPFPILGRVFGKVRGGGVGLTAACDLVIAASDTDFALTEIKHKLIPGIITPLVAGKVSQSRFTDWATSGRTVSLAEAREAGLVHFREGEKPQEEVLKKIKIHPLRSVPQKILGELDHYMELSAAYRRGMVRAYDIS